MKKILFVLILAISLTLAGCVPIDTGDNDDIGLTYTEEELREIISELMPEDTINTTYDMLSFQESIVEMTNEARTGVLGIESTSLTGYGTGSGVVYKKVDNTYYLITNQHVVEGSISLKIVYEQNGILFEITNEDITLVGTDSTTDIAVITFTSTQDFKVIPFADSYDLEIGQFVFAVGNPLGFSYYGTLTMGVISGLSRYVQDGTFDATLLQHDAAISPGNSGGALLNINGELVGINNMKVVQDDVSNIGFAIPANTVKRIATDLEDDGEVTRPYLGVTTNINQIDDNCNLTYGVCLSSVSTGGAADNAELERYDIIVGFKNEGMDDYLEINNFNDLREAILNSSVGETIKIKYFRNGIEYESIDTVLGVHPDD